MQGGKGQPMVAIPGKGGTRGRAEPRKKRGMTRPQGGRGLAGDLGGVSGEMHDTWGGETMQGAAWPAAETTWKPLPHTPVPQEGNMTMWMTPVMGEEQMFGGKTEELGKKETPVLT